MTPGSSDATEHLGAGATPRPATERMGTYVMPRNLAVCEPTSAALSLASYSRTMVSGLDEMDRYGALMHQLPRQFHALSAAEQAEVLLDRPPLTGTRWDAFLAAVVEHVARLHGHQVPAWVNEPARFLGIPWVISTNRVAAADSVLYAPGAFIRHSVFPDPADLDVRGGEVHAWIP
ncbi:MAG: hypothetical protein OXN89_09940 [Bryobacterales bacterium]|nr:hypothetical protein [Bryobacterales bacterium]